jgi:Protein of unknown function (DUF3040)
MALSQSELQVLRAVSHDIRSTDRRLFDALAGRRRHPSRAGAVAGAASAAMGLVVGGTEAGVPVVGVVGWLGLIGVGMALIRADPIAAPRTACAPEPVSRSTRSRPGRSSTRRSSRVRPDSASR